MTVAYTPSKFKQWIKWYGVKDLADELEISVITMHGWMKGISFPRVETMTRLIEISRYKLTYNEIIEGCYHEAKATKERKALREKASLQK